MNSNGTLIMNINITIGCRFSVALLQGGQLKIWLMQKVLLIKSEKKSAQRSF